MSDSAHPAFRDVPLFSCAPGHIAVKICGITTAQQAHDILALRPDSLGFNLWPGSKRYLPLEKNLAWLRELSGHTTRVAVTVDPTDQEIEEILASGAIDCLQLHGSEPSNRVNSLIQQGWPVFKAIGVQSEETLAHLDDYHCDVLLLDAYAPQAHGGTGEAFDWQLGARAVRMLEHKKILLAGGLTPANVASAIRQVKPHGVDVASGVESSPGLKDLDLVKAFLTAAREAFL